MEALPAVVFGLLCLVMLTDDPARARWLPDDERRWLVDTLAREGYARASTDGHAHGGLGALRDRRVLLLGALYFGTSIGLYVVGIWTPPLLSGAGLHLSSIGWVGAAINLSAVIAMVWWARRFDRSGSRLLYIALPCTLARCGLVLAGLGGTWLFLIVGLMLANIGVNAAKPPLWAVPPSFLDGAGAAAGIAMINSLGTLGGAVSPLLIGAMRQQDGSVSIGLFLTEAVLLMSTAVVLPLRRLLGLRNR